MILTKNRCALATVCIPASHIDDMESPLFFAAKQLRYYLGRMTAASFEISSPDERPAISLSFADGEEAERLGTDGFRIHSDSEKVEIVGGKRGVVYGMFELLERMGCRFFTSSCEKIPTANELSTPDIDDIQIPCIEYRGHDYSDATDNPKFTVKCRLNGHNHPIPKMMGGNISYVWHVHTFDLMVPAAKYGETHPEYFALVDGERQLYGPRTQLCLTNPEVYDLCLESVREALRAHPDAGIISISQNDYKGYCQCEKCRAVDIEEGSPSGTNLRFVNRIAEELEEEFPNVIFDTLAYQYSRPAPKYVRNRDNVCVRLCSIECCFSHPMESCDFQTREIFRPDGSRASFISDLRDWSKICDCMYIWDYTTSFANYPSPHPNWRVLQPNLQTFVKNNAKGVFEQANRSSHGGVDFNELRCYLISKLLWDPFCDIETHRREFMEYYYGEAAPALNEYLDLLCDYAERENIHVGFNDKPTGPLFDESKLDEYEALFDRAAAAVSGDPLRLWRVERNRLSIRWVRLKRKTMLRDEFDPAEIEKFFADWRGFGLTRIDEWFNIESTHRALLDKNWRATAYFRHFHDEEKEYL